MLVITIDGPSASGKGTLAKKISSHFSLPYLNTGAIYRLAALRFIEQKIDIKDLEQNIKNITSNINESDLENEILFSEDVGIVASMISKNQNLRSALFQFQIDFVSNGKKIFGGAVLDGRDTSTVICPDANYKFFVTANVEIRAKRRFDQLQKMGLKTSFDEILRQLKERDENDTKRTNSPLLIHKDAIVIDNGNLSIEGGFQMMLKAILV